MSWRSPLAPAQVPQRVCHSWGRMRMLLHPPRPTNPIISSGRSPNPLSSSLLPLSLSHRALSSPSLNPEPQDHVAFQSSMERQPSREIPNIHRRWWNISAFLKKMYRQHRRKDPIENEPTVGQSIKAVIKTSCEHPPPNPLLL